MEKFNKFHFRLAALALAIIFAIGMTPQSAANIRAAQNNNDVAVTDISNDQEGLTIEPDITTPSSLTVTQTDGSADDITAWLQYLENNGIEPQKQNDGTNFSTTNIVSMPAASSASSSDTINVSRSLLARSFIAPLNAVITKRYTALVLDGSGSMAGTPVTALIEAATKFCDSVLQADGENYVAIVTYDTYAYKVCNFTADMSTLQNAIARVYLGGSTNSNQAFVYAGDYLDAIPDDPNTVKNLIFMSDGLPNYGAYTSTGKYTYSDYAYYSYANAVYNTAADLKANGINIYTLGFFHSITGAELAFARRFMNDLQNSGYYDVVNPDDLEFAFGDVANKVTEVTKTFTYSGGNIFTGDQGDYQTEYTYNDNYFSDISQNYKPQLATMSLELAIAAFGLHDVDYGDKKADNVVNMLTDMGFIAQDIQTEGYKDNPTENSIAYVLAHKSIAENGKNYELVTLAVRGGEYASEWSGDFNALDESMFSVSKVLGLITTRTFKGGDHVGFRIACNTVKAGLLDYIKTKVDASANIKLWITGYSRSAAVANLLTADIDNSLNEQSGDFSNLNLQHNDVYSYLFATPNNSTYGNNTATFNNIFNTINPNDPVPRFPFSSWGFKRYGQDRYLPEPNSQDYANNEQMMLSTLNELNDVDPNNRDPFNSNAYLMDQFKVHQGNLNLIEQMIYDIGPHKGRTQETGRLNIFLDTLVNKTLAGAFGSPENYLYKGLQDKAVDGAGLHNGVVGGFNGAIGAITSNLLVSLKLATPNNDDNIATLGRNDLTDLASSDGGAEHVAYNIQDYGWTSPGVTSGTNYDPLYYLQCEQAMKDSALEAHNNSAAMTSGHYPELYLAWLKTLGGTDTQQLPNRVIHIKCPVDAQLYDVNNNLVGSIVNDTPEDLSQVDVVATVDSIGEKEFYVPGDQAYTIKLTATNNGEMTYTVDEITPGGDLLRMVTYYNVIINKGDTFTGAIDNLQIDGKPSYPLVGDNGQNIPTPEDLSGDVIPYYNIDVEADGNGIVNSDGYIARATLTTIRAIPDEGYSFIGWYKGNTLISTDPLYTFIVQGDEDFTGKFSSSGTIVTPVYPISGGYKTSPAQPPTVTQTITSTPSLTPTVTFLVIQLTIGNKVYTKNGVQYTNDVAPYISDDNRTMVPVRLISEALGAKVDWDDATRTVTVTQNDKTMQIVIDQPLPNEMGIAVIQGSRTFVPIRYISEQLGANVDWDATTKTVTITMNNPSDTTIVGSYSSDRTVTDNDLSVFNEAMAGIMGVDYQPTLVATQVVSGANYRFTATATPVVPNAVAYTVYIYIFKPLQGPAQLTQIVNV